MNVSAYRSLLKSVVGVFGLLAAGRGTAGERRLRRGRWSTALALSVAGFALLAGVAQAEVPKLISYDSFASESPGIAVDQANGDVFTAGLLKWEKEEITSGGHINEFDAGGHLISPPSPFPAEAGLYGSVAVESSSGNVYALSSGYDEATKSFKSAIDIFESSGRPVVSFEVPDSGTVFGVASAVAIAVDSAGDVYVPVAPSNEVLEYSSTGTLLKTFTGSTSALKEPSGVAVDTEGDVWVADQGNNRIEELSQADAPLKEIKSEGIESLALDGHEDVLAVVANAADACGSLKPPCAHLVEYDEAGSQVADVGAGEIYGLAFGTPIGMVAVDEATGRVYVSDDFKNTVWIYGPPTTPVLGKELAAEVGSSKAKLGAVVNPGGIDASYIFEYGITAAYGNKLPFPEGDAGTGVKLKTVWATASDLAPGTMYHYRVVVTNALGSVVGSDETFMTETSAQTSCPNESLRTGFSAGLPDCRAYELVTPPSTSSAQPDPGGLKENSFVLEGNFAGRSGERMAYRATDVLPGSQSAGAYYIAERGPGGWSSVNEMPAENYYQGYQCTKTGGRAIAYSADLTKGILQVGGNQVIGEATEPGHYNEFGGGCGGTAPELVSGEPRGAENLVVRDNADGAYKLVNVTPSGVTPTNAKFLGASVEGNHVIFEERAKLTSDALNDVENLYEWNEGIVRLVTLSQNGTPVEGKFAGISADGSDVLFAAEGNLYARVDGAETVQVDASQAGGSGGGGVFVHASADGSRVLFTDDASSDLTGNTVAGSGTNLYEYDRRSKELVDLTPAAKAEVLQGTDASEDGSYVYFAVEGVLTGAEENEHGETAQSGQSNLYLRRGGKTTFIATGACQGTNCRRVSGSGAFYAFESKKRLTGYDNTDAITASLDPEIYLYDAATNSLACASCDPSGEAPSGGGAFMEPALRGPETPHYLAEDGRIFFETSEALLPADSNGQADVYEYEANGTGGCAQSEGCLHLISTGTGSTPTLFIDASASGNDVFILDTQALIPLAGTQEARAIYDARVDGGFTESVSPPACTNADSCRTAAVPQPSIYGAPSSQTFEGAGNLPPAAKLQSKKKTKSKKCGKGRVKRNGRCVKPNRRGSKAGKSNDSKRHGRGQ